MVDELTAHSRFANYYAGFVRGRSTDFNAIETEYPQLEQALAWLSVQSGSQPSSVFLSFIRNLSPYLEARSLNDVILKYIGTCMARAQQVGQNLGWIYLLAYRANWALGRWNEAHNQVVQAVEESSHSNPMDYAGALRYLGTFQLNRGDYAEAMKTFAQAKRIFQDLGNTQGLVSIKSEEAAYYLNKADYLTAYHLYAEIEQDELTLDQQISDHTLLMLGVVLRRLKKYFEAKDYLDRLLKRTQENQSINAYATAAHHMAWVYLDWGDFSIARDYALMAMSYYDRINDARGISDSNDQLGVIAMAMGQLEESLVFLERAALTRKQLGNKQGYASTLSRLARLNFIRGHYLSGVIHLAHGLLLYYKIGMLSAGRLYRMIDNVFRHQFPREY